MFTLLNDRVLVFFFHLRLSLSVSITRLVLLKLNIRPVISALSSNEVKGLKSLKSFPALHLFQLLHSSVIKHSVNDLQNFDNCHLLTLNHCTSGYWGPGEASSQTPAQCRLSPGVRPGY